MAKAIFFYPDWQNTTGNHTGMAYLAQTLSQMDKNIIALKIPNIQRHKVNLFGIQKLSNLFEKIYFKVRLKLCVLIYYYYFKLALAKDDKLFLMEYLTESNYRYFQEDFAKLFYANVKFELIGIIHLPLSYLINFPRFSDKKIITGYLNNLSKVLVLGNSLKVDLINLGCNVPITTTFHYVDDRYYYPIQTRESDKLRVVIIGSLLRDFDMLIDIINNCPDIHFYFCLGNENLEKELFLYDNVKLMGYMAENKLREVMQNSDVSLNVLLDTIGSNVITTSMACGLPLVVSDIGSIRDYCNDSNAFFCNSLNDFTSALNYINNNKNILQEMSIASRNIGVSLNVENFYNDLKVKNIL